MQPDTVSGGEVPESEVERLAAVHRYDVLDTPPDGAFDRVTALAARFFGVPIAIVSIVDEDRIWFKSHHGVDVEEVDREPGLCASAILHDKPWVVSDATSDPRAMANPLVAGTLGLRFYAGAPLTTSDGFNLGTLCVIDIAPREVTDSEVAALKDLASIVVAELELRLAARRAVELEQQLRQQAEELARAELRRAQLDLEYQAFHDPLTGLGNRARFDAGVAAMLMRAHVERAPVAVVLIDLDSFKRINDSLGHVAGDAVLVEVSRRLRGCAPGCELAVRLGADEFIFVLENASRADAVAMASRMLDALSRPVVAEGVEVLVGASIGIVCDRDAGDAAHLLRCADLAMFQAKQQGGGRHVVFDAAMQVLADSRLTLESEMRAGLRDRRFRLVYQPVVSLSNGAMTGVEALLRFDRPGGARVSPAEFIPLAEETGLIVALGEWVLSEACEQLARWDASQSGGPRMSMAVNVSLHQLDHPGFINTVRNVVTATGLDPGRLVLEITESAMGDDEGTAMLLRELRRTGVKLSIDDFGTGYSSLARLQTSPVDYVKLDHKFVAEIDGAGTEAPIVRAIMAMASGMGLGTIAEGIETPQQFAYLASLGCQEGQGYLMSRPVTPDTIPELLEATPSRSPDLRTGEGLRRSEAGSPRDFRVWLRG